MLHNLRLNYSLGSDGIISSFYAFLALMGLALVPWFHWFQALSPTSDVDVFSTMKRQDDHLQLDPKRSNLRSYAHGQLRLEQAKLTIAYRGSSPEMGGKQTSC
jgi:hypothetical protein